MSLDIRAEFFNLFTHAQFNNPGGDFAGGFGVITSARDPRIGQVALRSFSDFVCGPGARSDLRGAASSVPWRGAVPFF